MTGTRDPWFELVHSDAGWFVRFKAGNSREVFRTSEVYQRRRGAEHAIDLLDLWRHFEIREVDERGET